jgi:ribosomal protein S18 acetylase RimI-like enzyme
MFQPGEEMQFTVGTRSGLTIVQQEFEGIVQLHRMHCRTDRARFRPNTRHPVSKLAEQDAGALARYPASRNRDVFFRLFREGKVQLYGCYAGGEIVAYSAVLPHSNEPAAWLHVRPECRQQGYGSSLVSAGAMDLFRRHDVLYYEADLEAIGAVRLCLSLGFAPFRLTCYFRGRRRGRPIQD